MANWGPTLSDSKASLPREVFHERHYNPQQQVVEQRQHQQQAAEGENVERCNILSTFFGDLLHRCVREEEFARTGPVLRQYLQQQQCTALNRAAGYLDGNQQFQQFHQFQGAATSAATPPRADASNLPGGTPSSQLRPSASAWTPNVSPAQQRDTSSRGSTRRAVGDRRPPSDPLAAMQGASGGQGFSLRTILKALDHVPTGCVLMAKKFNRLGSNAVSALQGHFGAFGVVRHILVPDVNACQVWQRTGRRRKPANQAFVIMADSAAVDRVLGAMRKHLIQGQVVQVTRFEHHDAAASQPIDGEQLSLADGEEAQLEADSMEMAEAAEADASLEKGNEKDGYDRQISSSTADTMLGDYPRRGDGNISSSSGDDRRSGDEGAWTDGGEGGCEISGDFEYWETDNEGL